ncbi:hypothetical protein EDB19DRAFT_1627863, partial [Suillus lakei]
LDIFRAFGAEVVDPCRFSKCRSTTDIQPEGLVLGVDFTTSIRKSISELVEVPSCIKTLARWIGFNKTAESELPLPFYTNQSRYVSLNLMRCYFAALTEDLDFGCTRGTDATPAQCYNSTNRRTRSGTFIAAHHDAIQQLVPHGISQTTLKGLLRRHPHFTLKLRDSLLESLYGRWV